MGEPHPCPSPSFRCFLHRFPTLESRVYALLTWYVTLDLLWSCPLSLAGSFAIFLCNWDVVFHSSHRASQGHSIQGVGLTQPSSAASTALDPAAG